MQTQQIISAATGNFFFGRAGAATTEKAVDNSFEKMFQASSEKYDKFTADKAEHVATEETVSSNTEEVNEVTASSEEKVTGKENAKDTESVQKDTAEPDEKELAERVAEVIAQVTEVVKDVLHLTTEQLEETMQLLGITEIDLLNADVLKQMVLTVNGEQDAAAFLMDSDMLSQMQQLLGETEAILEGAGIHEDELFGMLENEEFAALLGQATEELAEAGTEKKLSEELPAEQTETVAVKKTEITFQAENAEAKTEMSNDKSGENADSQADFTQDNAGLSNQFIQNLQNAVNEGVKETAFGATLAEQIREIANQILEQVKVIVAQEMTSLEIQLTPDHLGKLNITVTEQDGAMKATFVTENELAKEAIESNLIQFKQMMNEQGIRVEAIEVTVSEFAFDKNGETGQSAHEEKKQSKARFIMEEEGNTPTSMQDELALHFMEGGESTVNYMA